MIISKLRSALARLIAGLDFLFDFGFGSRWNPLYRSGTWAVGLLLVVTVTGLYLLLFYRIGSPFESMTQIQASAWTGRWVRSVHRYASDLAALAVLIHVLRMFAEGKSWGPRLMAWLSGVLLLGMLLVSGWTGYVMVWDRFGQELAVAGARVFEVLPLFKDSVGFSFSGAQTLGGSFFFMNLFLHVAVPLGMVFAMWVHTLRLARSRWFPTRQGFVAVFSAIVAVAVLWPAPLEGPADLLSVQSKMPVDVFFAFWLPLLWKGSPGAVFALHTIGFAVLVLVPWFSREPEPKPVSVSNPLKCTGCEQCMKDCPFGAISMVPRTDGTGSAKVSKVDPLQCVSCGVCVGSCSQFALGPPGRTAREQVALAAEIRKEDPSKEGLAIVFCESNPGARRRVERLASEAGVPASRLVGVECVGSMHVAMVAGILAAKRGVFVWGCPPSLCQSREGTQVFEERVSGARDPVLPKGAGRERVRFFAASSAEFGDVARQFREFVGGLAVTGGAPGGTGRTIRAVLSALLVGFACAAATQVKMGIEPSQSFVRVAWKLPGQVHRVCRKWTEAELAAKPLHMRTPEDCSLTVLKYRLVVEVDHQRLLDREIAPKGARGDRPLVVNTDLEVAPGDHQVEVKFYPADDALGEGKRYEIEFKERFEPGRAVMVGMTPDGTRLTPIRSLF